MSTDLTRRGFLLGASALAVTAALPAPAPVRGALMYVDGACVGNWAIPEGMFNLGEGPFTIDGWFRKIAGVMAIPEDRFPPDDKWHHVRLG